MSYFKEAFGGFAPHLDEDAAVKFALNVILMDHRLDELTKLLTDGDEIGGVEGVPGWIIERRDSGSSGELAYYSSWPPGVSFRAYVDPGEYELANPEFFMDESIFHQYVESGLKAYICANPDRASTAGEVFSKINKLTINNLEFK